MKPYSILTPRGTVESIRAGRYAGWNGGRRDCKIFGRLTCASGKRLMLPKNRVFFLSWEDAVACGFRPCKKCLPEPDDEYELVNGVWYLRT